jgi:restriction system protein
MARSVSFSRVITTFARETVRTQRQLEAAQRRDIRETARQTREIERNRRLMDKEEKQRYLEDRLEGVADLNEALTERLKELHRILEATLEVDDTISFDFLRLKSNFPPLVMPRELLSSTNHPLRDSYIGQVKKPGLFSSVLPGSNQRYQEALKRAEASYQAAVKDYEAAEALRKAKLDKLASEHEKARQEALQKAEQRNQEVDEFENAYREGDSSAIEGYCTMVLERSNYPDGFPQFFRLAHVPESSQLVVEYELPSVSIVPPMAEYKYVKSKDTIEEKPRKIAECKELYSDIVAAVALRTLHELFEADQGNHIEVIVFNGFVQTIDPATGRDIQPCLLSVRSTKQVFEEVDLGRVDKRACLKNLGAQASAKPADMIAVKPIIEFSMVDKRFVGQEDILSGIDSTTNLYELDPFAFENLVSNLFNQMGLECKLTRSSKDGGVDAVAFDPRPVLGGKIVIQAKRYRNTVDVSAVRDLYGTMVNEGANKGILVTTSGYGPDAYNFAKDKPIELITGGGLLYMLEQVGIKARISFPSNE